jgi:hypothetical protein
MDNNALNSRMVGQPEVNGTDNAYRFLGTPGIVGGPRQRKQLKLALMWEACRVSFVQFSQPVNHQLEALHLRRGG